MNDLFDLKTDPSELASANGGVARISYEQKAPSRTISAGNFSNGAISIPFQVSGSKWWIPSQSYLRIRGAIYAEDTDAGVVEKTLNVAPVMGTCGTLFQSCNFKLNGTTLSTLGDFVPQVDALDTRMSKTKPWLDGVGNSTNFWEKSYEKRQNSICIDGFENDGDGTTYSKSDLGFVGANTIAIVAATGVATFAVGTVPNLTTTLQIGDVFRLATELVGGSINYTVVRTPASATTVELSPRPDANIAAVAIGAFTVFRPKHTPRANRFEMKWTPPLSIFNRGTALPVGDYELVLNPQASNALQINAMESASDIFTPGTDANFKVDSLFLYVATVDGPRVEDITYYIDLEQTRCQSSDITNSVGLTQHPFDVSPTTTSLTVAFQDSRVGTSCRHPATKFKIGAVLESEKKLTSFYVNFGGQSKPTPNGDTKALEAAGTTAGESYFTQLYVDSLLNNDLYMESGGPESLADWFDRGMYFHYQWPRDGSDRSTRATANVGFSEAVEYRRVLMFDRFRQVATVQVQNGRVVRVSLDDV